MTRLLFLHVFHDWFVSLVAAQPVALAESEQSLTGARRLELGSTRSAAEGYHDRWYSAIQIFYTTVSFSSVWLPGDVGTALELLFDEHDSSCFALNYVYIGLHSSC